MLEVGSALLVPYFRNSTHLDLQVGSTRDLGVRHLELKMLYYQFYNRANLNCTKLKIGNKPILRDVYLLKKKFNQLSPLTLVQNSRCRIRLCNYEFKRISKDFHFFRTSTISKGLEVFSWGSSKGILCLLFWK